MAPGMMPASRLDKDAMEQARAEADFHEYYNQHDGAMPQQGVGNCGQGPTQRVFSPWAYSQPLKKQKTCSASVTITEEYDFLVHREP